LLSDDLLEGRDMGSPGETVANGTSVRRYRRWGAQVSLQLVHLVRVRARGKLGDLKAVVVLGDGGG
jgi:hypothetical protein